MGVKLGEAVVYLLGDQEGIEGSLKDTERKTDAWAGKIAGGVTKVIGGAFKAVAIGAATAGVATAGALATTIGPASDLSETVSKVGVVFGEEADRVLEFGASAAHALGMTKEEALAAAGTYGNLFRAMQLTEDKSADMSTGLVQLAADLAAFNNMDPSEVLDKLRAGLTGETEPLKSLGVNMNQAMLKAKALEMGLIGVDEEMTAAAKAQAAYAIIMEQTALAQGDFARTSEGLANQQRILKAQLGDLRAEIGTALLPILEMMIGAVTQFAQSETFQAWVAAAVGGLEKLTGFLSEIIDLIAWTVDQGGNLEAVLRNVLSLLLEQLGLTEEQIDGVFEVINNVQDAFTAVVGFIEENAVPILAGLAAALLTIVVPAFVSWAGAAAAAAAATIAALAPVLAPILAIGAAVALLVKAWQNDWGGIRTTLTQFWERTGRPIFDTVRAWLEEKLPQGIAVLKRFWEEVLLPALQAVWAFIEQRVFPTFAVAWQWLAEKIPAAVQTAADFWNETLKPALEAVWAFLKDSVFPIFTTAWEWLQEKLPAAVQTLSDFWNETLLPAITAVWAFIDEYIIPIFNALVDVYIAALNLALTALQGIWEKVLLPALEAVWKFIKEDIGPILEELAEGWLAGVQLAAETLATFWTETLKPALEAVWKFIRDNLGPILEWFRDEVVKRLTDALDGLKGALTWVKDRLNELKDALKNVKLPDWLTPGSPTPFEMGLRGIADAMAELNRVELPRLQTNLAMAGAAGGGLASAASVVNHTYEITNWSPEPESRLNLSNLISALELAHAS